MLQPRKMDPSPGPGPLIRDDLESGSFFTNQKRGERCVGEPVYYGVAPRVRVVRAPVSEGCVGKDPSLGARAALGEVAAQADPGA